jgi:antitoxin component YwqK of YwqJK toxin-antitoxin module
MKYFYLTLICLTIFLNLGAEIVNSYYPSGKIESTGNMVNGKKQGEWKWFFENGKISLQGKYFTDKEEGEWVWFHTNGIPFAIGYFVDGTPLGNWKRYNKFGKLLTEENSSWGDNAKSFREGIMYRNATCIGIRKDALQEGLWRYFSNNGDIISECNYTNGKKNGIYKSYSRDYDINEKINFTTEEGNYINGKREGIWKKVNALGIILQKMIFRNDILEGSFEKFDKDGVLLTSGQYKNGKKNGFWIENEDDVVFKGYYINDDLDGECTWYFSTGKIKYKGNYKQGKLIDRWKEYYKEWQKPYQQNKYNTDPLYRLRMCVGTRMRLSLNSNNQIKLGKTIDYLGCDYNQLKQHLESKFIEGMNWDNFGIDGWEIDHIIPLSKGGSFHYTNLQPLWWKDNRSKGSKLP